MIMEIKESEFIKLGDNIVPKPKGVDYDLIPGKVYDLSFDGWNDRILFTENGLLNMPKTVFETEEDKIFKKCVLNSFNKHPEKDVGVLLAGTKGTGKTVLSKVIALESNLPIIVVDPNFPAAKLVSFFKQFSTPVCILFDEIEKNFKTEKLLEFLDGVQKTAHKLVLMTCNKLEEVSEYLLDRCSRVRYLRKYKAEDNLAFLDIILESVKIENKEEIKKFCKERLALPSLDNMYTLLNEYKELKETEDENISIEDAAKYLNITLK